jgi:phosphate transport system protein
MKDVPIRLQREIERLKKNLLRISAVVEESFWMALNSVKERNLALARKAIDNDSQIDTMEVDLEEDCLKLLALYQPVARDLRLIIAVLKINNDLERVGDLAVNIAERAFTIVEQEHLPLPKEYFQMAEKVRWMLTSSIDSLVNSDAALAHRVCISDDAVDALNKQVYEMLKAEMLRDPKGLETLIGYLSVFRQLERIADHATNIAEDVIYLIEGQIIRHREPDSDNKPAK